jgi:UDP-glucose 4-epimerase
MRALVTGAAGFVGSHLVDALLARGDEVVGFDNLSTGFDEFLEGAHAHPRFALVQGDLLDPAAPREAVRGADIVFHLAANADIRFGTQRPRRDLEQNTIATMNLLDAMRDAGCRRIAFSSTGSVYGEAQVFPTPEDAPFPVQTSLYGASKLACEGLISAHCEGFGFGAAIFRFVSILGPRYTHGHVFDFARRLLDDPARLPVLGDGRQRKSYLHVEDCVRGVLLAADRIEDGACHVLNLGQDGACEVRDSIGWICDEMGVSPRLDFAGGARGWVGDSPFILLDCTRMRGLGWAPRQPIEASVRATLRWLLANRWVLERRA